MIPDFDDFDDDFEPERFQSEIVSAYWRTKDGQYLRINEMTTDHIMNCVAMMQRNYQNTLDQIVFPQKVSEEEQNLAERRFFALQSSTPSAVYPIYNKMLDELKRRLFS